MTINTFTFSDDRLTFNEDDGRFFFGGALIDEDSLYKDLPCLRVTCNKQPVKEMSIPVGAFCVKKSVPTDAPGDYVAITNSDLRGLGDFIMEYAPWSMKFLREYSWDVIADESGFFESYQPNRKFGWSLYIALIISRPALYAIKPGFALSDMFYVDGNISTLPGDIMYSRDIREFCWRLFGCYSSHLAEAVMRVGKTWTVDGLTIFTLLKEMAPEKIIEYLNGNGFHDAIVPLSHRGVPDRYPHWYLNAPDSRRLKWLTRPSVLVDCIEMYNDMDEKPDIDFRTGDIFAIHDQLIKFIDDSDIEYSVEHCDLEDKTIDGIDVMPARTARQMVDDGAELDICVGSKEYISRFTNGLSLFFRVNDNGDEYMLETNVIGDTIEFNSAHNNGVAPGKECIPDIVRSAYFAI